MRNHSELVFPNPRVTHIKYPVLKQNHITFNLYVESCLHGIGLFLYLKGFIFH